MASALNLRFPTAPVMLTDAKSADRQKSAYLVINMVYCSRLANVPSTMASIVVLSAREDPGSIAGLVLQFLRQKATDPQIVQYGVLLQV